jgi:hypothetical protein
VRGSTTATAFDQISDNDSGAYGLSNTPTTVTITASATGSIPLGGSGTDIDILPPVRVGTFYFKL